MANLRIEKETEIKQLSLHCENENEEEKMNFFVIVIDGSF